MSLKAFHIIFIIVSTLFSFGTGALFLNMYNEKGIQSDMYWGYGLMAGGLALIIYGVYFLKKLKRISYL